MNTSATKPVNTLNGLTKLRPPSKLAMPKKIIAVAEKMDVQTLPSKIKRQASPKQNFASKRPRIVVSNVQKPLGVSHIQKRARRSINMARQVQMTKRAKENKTSNDSTINKVSRAPLTKRAPVIKKNLNVSTTRPQARSTKTTTPPLTSVTVPKPKKRAAWDVKGKLADLEENFQVLKAQFEQTNQQVTVAEKGKAEIKGQYSQKVAELESNITNYKEELNQKTLCISQMEEKLRVQKDNFDHTLYLQKSQWETEKMSLQTDRSLLERKVADYNRQCNEQKQSIKEWESKCLYLEDELKKSKNDIIKYHEERKKLLNEVQELKGNIRVFVRSRPLLKKETIEADIMYENDGKTLQFMKDEKATPFKFDKVFGPASTQAEVFEELSMLTQSALDGYNICVFAYGQTGSGKTHTMEGPTNGNEENMGVIQRTMIKIFDSQKPLLDLGWKYEFKVQQVEIYKENLRDLLKEDENKNDKLGIKTVGNNGRIWVENLSEHPVHNLQDVMDLLKLSRKRRATASTLANNRSSRSHSVFILKIFAQNTNTNTKMESWLNLVDLAGSERIANTGAEGARMDEAKSINKSLQHLSKVILEISSKSNHISYRGSKLTFLLKDCIGGNSKTLMLVNINPSAEAYNESIRTLTFASTVNQCNIGTAQRVVKM